MRVLVTGGAGFIGSNLVQHLSGESVATMSSCSTISRRVKPAGVAAATHFVHGDFTDKPTLADCLKGVDAIVHLAALSGGDRFDRRSTPKFRVNVIGSFQLLELARAAKVRRLVNASTGGALLGDVTPPITETMAPCPLVPLWSFQACR